MFAERVKWWKIVLLIALLFLFWTFIVCFPNPFIFTRNVIRYIRFPVDPSVIDIIQVKVPDEPQEIEKFVIAQ